MVNWLQWTKRAVIALGVGSMALSAQAAVVLQYHHVSDSTPPSTSVTPERFKKHMAYIADLGYEVVPLEELVAALKRGDELPDKTVAITFDDAYDSVYDTAFPLLKKRGWPFTVFVNTDPVDRNRNGFNSWEELREMAEAGATIANHSAQHNHLQRRQSGESRKQWRQRIEAEVVDAERRIEEETGQEHKILAYPYGEYSEELMALLDDWGFTAFAQNSGPLARHNNLRAMPRFPFGGPFGDPEDFASKVKSRPMPLESVARYPDRELREALPDGVVRAGTKPVLVLELEDADLAPRVNCFASRQGAISVERDGKRLIVQANEALSPGRTQYNCTAGSGESGRFFWQSQQWLVTDPEGNWVHND